MRSRYKNTRRGVTKARLNREFKDIIFNEIWIISIALGLYFKSWWVFAGSIVGLGIIISIEELAKIFIIIASLSWGCIIGGIGALIGGSPAMIVLGVFGFLGSLSAHQFSLQYVQDVILDGEDPTSLSNFAFFNKVTNLFQHNSKNYIPDHVKRFVWKRDCGKCVKCGTQDNLEYAHILSLSQGGFNTTKNIRLLCNSCKKRIDSI
ncbi:HNH endonuclease [bacterium]|nr:HNH endonuclease [bacterium]